MNKKLLKLEVKPIYKEIGKSEPINDSSQKKCDLCDGVGYYQERKGGAVHTCWKCLKDGKL